MNTYTTNPGRTTRAPEVMVSYSSQDRERVMQFVRALRAAGVAVWIDQGGIDGAQRWSEEIVNAIEACRTVMLFISRTSMESQNISKEVALAWESGKHFLPVALEEAKIPKSMQYQLAGIQYVKLYEGDADAKFESVLRALVRLGVRVSPYSMAVINAGIGDREQTLEWLGKACEERSAALSRLKTELRFNPMRSDPRFAELARRAESIALDAEDVSADIVLPQSLTMPAQRSAPAWKRIVWPDIVDAKSAREAAGLAVWASAAIIVARWLVSFVVTTPSIAGFGWWNDPIILTVIFVAIGFGVQKMGRPAAVIGTVLCALGALFNLNALSFLRSAMEAQQQYSQMGQQSYGQPNYSALYYAALFGGIAGIVFVLAFVNGWRGTFAYHAMVQARQTQDKQDALSQEDLLAVRRKVMAVVQRAWGMLPRSRTKAVPEPVLTSATTNANSTALPFRAPVQAPVIALQPEAEPSRATESTKEETQPLLTPRPALVPQAPLVEKPELPPATLDEFPKIDDAPAVHSLTDLIGSNPFHLTRAAVFMAANVVTGLAFMLSRSILLSGPFHPVYWQFAIVRGLAFTLATLLAFHFLRRGWIAALVAAAATALVMLPVSHFTLGTFDIRDLFYREQFQEFLLLPFVDSLVLLFGLFVLIPRIRPLALALWTGSVCAEIATSMLLTTLRELGAGPPPDPVLAGGLAFFVGVRSLVFAAVLWAGLRFSGASGDASAAGHRRGGF